MDKIHEGLIIDERYKLVMALGHGSFGRVWLASDMVSNAQVAVKFYKSVDDFPDWERYSKLVMGLDSPYLTKVLSSGIWKGCPYIVMEYFEEGDAFKLVGKLRPCLEDERLIWTFIYDIASGLAYLHNKSIFHQDIKLTNILMNKGHFVIADYETLCRVECFSDVRATVPYVVCPGLHPFLEMDFWPMAYSVYELASGESAFAHHKLEIHPLSSQWSETLRNFLQEDSGYPTLNGKFDLLAEEILKGNSLEVFYASKEANVSSKGIIDLKSHVNEEKADENAVVRIKTLYDLNYNNFFNLKITPEMEQCLQSIKITNVGKVGAMGIYYSGGDYGIVDAHNIIVGFKYDKIEPFCVTSYPHPGRSPRLNFIGAFFHQGNDVGYLKIMEDGSIEEYGRCSNEEFQRLRYMT